MVKFSWPSDTRHREGELLRLAKERGVTGIAMWFNHKQVTIGGDLDNISHLRQDIKFGTLYKVSSKAYRVECSLETSRKGTAGSGATHLVSLGIGPSSAKTSSGQKWEAVEKLDRGSKLKRPRYDSSHASGANVPNPGCELDKIGPHKIQDPAADSLAKCRNELRWSNVDSIQEAEADSLTESDTYDNRLHIFLVTLPAGRPLYSFNSVRELLEALRDAIRGHRSLFQFGRILHQDISENNVIITDLPAKEAPKGRLIDLDLAKELTSPASGARHRTGTMQFMAIGFLRTMATRTGTTLSHFFMFLYGCVFDMATKKVQTGKPQ